MATHRTALTQSQAIKGLGGIGKTQIAVEYAYRARSQGRYTYLLWINAASEEAILTSFQTLAEQLPNFAARDEKDQRKLIAAILHWLEACSEPWLLIFDNADELALVQPYLPQQGQGSILLTTRATAVGGLANSIEVEQMGLVEGTQLLLHRTQRLQALDEECNEASNVVIALDGFPLALDQAGAYIEETGCSFGDYLQLYEQHRARLLARRGKQASNYPASVATTWSLSFQKIEQTHPAAAELLRLCAYLSPDHIPEELLKEGAAHWPALLQQAVADPLRFNELLEALLAFSLVKRLPKARQLSLHRLVLAVQLDRMESQEQHQWAERVICAVNELFPADPKDQVETWPQCLRYLEQVQACGRLIQQYHLQSPEAADLLDRAGVYLREHASYSLAESLFQRALVIAEQQLGPQHLQVASPLTNLANLYREQGKYELAEPLYQRALHIWEQALGPDHPQVARPLNGLASLYYDQSKHELAEPLLQRALHVWEQALGPDHPHVAYSLNHLGNLYYEQGKYELAEPLLQRALHIWEQALGPDHPHVAHPLNNLGNLYYEQGKYELAEPLLQRALHIWEQALGPHHPHVAYPLNNLGNLYYEQGKYELAEPLLQRALHIWEQALGPACSHVAYPLNGLANLSREQGKYEQADALYQRALAIRQEHLGLQHIDAAETLQDLARLRQIQQQPTEALSLYQRALAIREQVLGALHPKTTDTRERLRAVLLAMGKTEAAAMLQAAQPDEAKLEGEQATCQEQ
jgi:tetratricopeptide (TPR) repeat protein